MMDQIIQLILSLITVIIAIFVFAFFYKKLGRSASNKESYLTILATLPLGTREKLILVQIGNEQLLLGATNHTISTLHQLTEPIAINQADQSAKKTK